METEALVVDALAQLGLDAHIPEGASDAGVDLILDTGGVRLALQVKRRALVTDSVAEQALRTLAPHAEALLIVADRVTETARKILTTRQAGYYDLRGRLALRADGVVIDAEVAPLRERSGRTSPLSGKVGLEIAANLLMRPQRETAVRDLARQLGRSASTVSEVLSALRREGMVDAKNAVTDSRLFWLVADRWATPRTYLAQLPPPGDAALSQALRLGVVDVEHETGWALTDSAAAAAYGAPVAFRSGQALDFYVPDQTVQRRAATLLGAASTPAQARATVRIAPAPAVVQSRVHLDANPMEWPLAHPLFVALDLAQDVGRGREILDNWTPGEGWSRVW
ncbi:ArsR family transcriptional regulator [Actinoplanes solisilvae]|uniref:ArsR family transcriptional regulator n=1 Tax=Actinoplanes solisilvae TaxID=2486853 RepID=UPI000FD788DB|nr:ArsR family transcriptional regulator [Actinoplanes solisilvae]